MKALVTIEVPDEGKLECGGEMMKENIRWDHGLRGLGGISDMTFQKDEDSLDLLLEKVADHISADDGVGTGVIKDKLDNILARRKVKMIVTDWRFNPMGKAPNPKPNPKKMREDIALAQWMRGHGFAFREIAKELGCSVGKAHRLAHWRE